jgi:hypothetical protein
LNVFHFLEDPYNPTDTGARSLSKSERARLAIERERELRLYYDKRAGDYLDVGFRLCEDNEWTELHRCLVIREFQVLVLGYPAAAATFAGKAIEEFANQFVCPVVLVGPQSARQFHINTRAGLIAEKLALPKSGYSTIQQVAAGR